MRSKVLLRSGGRLRAAGGAILGARHDNVTGEVVIGGPRPFREDGLHAALDGWGLRAEDGRTDLEGRGRGRDGAGSRWRKRWGGVKPEAWTAGLDRLRALGWHVEEVRSFRRLLS